MTPYSHLLTIHIEERIRALWVYRRWHRNQSPHLRQVFDPLAREYAMEARALLKVRRQARNEWRRAEVARTNEYDRRLDHIIEEQRYPVA